MATPKKSIKTQTEQHNEVKDAAVREKVATITPESALRSLGTAQAAIGKLFGNAAEQVAAALQELETVKRATELEREELTKLRGIDTVSKNLEDLQKEYEDLKVSLTKAHDEEALVLAAQEAEATRRFDEKQAVMELEFTQKKLAAQSAFEQTIHTASIAERDRREMVEKNWALREEVLATKEKEFASLQAQVAAFPEQLKKDTDKATAIATNSVKSHYEHQLQLIQKDAEVEKKLAKNSIDSLQLQLDTATAQLASANARIAASEEKVQSIATKALDAASGRQSLAELQSFQQSRSDNGASARKG